MLHNKNSGKLSGIHELEYTPSLEDRFQVGPGSSKTWLCSKCSGQKYFATTANRREFHFDLYIYVLHVSKIARNRPNGSDCAACCRHQAVHKEWGVLWHVETTIDTLNYLIIKMPSFVYPTSIAQMRKCSFGLWNWIKLLQRQ